MQSPKRTFIVPAKKQVIADDTFDDVKESGTGCNFDLGYALSCHKAQGSEFPHVFVLIDDNAGRVCDASWMLTALSRGKLHATGYGRFETARRYCRVQRLDQRKTFLRERIVESQISMELAGL